MHLMPRRKPRMRERVCRLPSGSVDSNASSSFSVASWLAGRRLSLNAGHGSEQRGGTVIAPGLGSPTSLVISGESRRHGIRRGRRCLFHSCMTEAQSKILSESEVTASPCAPPA